MTNPLILMVPAQHLWGISATCQTLTWFLCDDSPQGRCKAMCSLSSDSNSKTARQNAKLNFQKFLSVGRNHSLSKLTYWKFSPFHTHHLSFCGPRPFFRERNCPWWHRSTWCWLITAGPAVFATKNCWQKSPNYPRSQQGMRKRDIRESLAPTKKTQKMMVPCTMMVVPLLG